MRRLARWTLNALTVLSLLVCVATVGLWVRSYRVEDVVRRGFDRVAPDGSITTAFQAYRSAQGELTRCRYRLTVDGPQAAAIVAMAPDAQRRDGAWRRGPGDLLVPPPPMPSATHAQWDGRGLHTSWDHDEGVMGHGGINHVLMPRQPDWDWAVTDVRVVRVQYAWLVIATLLVPGCRVLWLAFGRSARREGSGVCPKCSYDLTGNVSGVCPECGTGLTRVAGDPRPSEPMPDCS